MFTLKSRSAAAALAAGLAISLAACGSDDAATTGETGAGATSSEPVAAIDSLTGVQTAVTLDPSFLEGITGLGLTPANLGSATLDADTGVIAFPITGGNVDYYDPNGEVQPYVQGLINHDGSGLSLSAGDTTVLLEDFEVDPDESLLYGTVTVDGEVFAERADLFFLDGSTLNPLVDGTEAGTAVLEGTTVSLTATAADALNMVFETDALTEFFLVGVAEITINTGA